MPVQEEVLIVLKAKDEVSKTVEEIRKNIENLSKTFNGSMPNGEQFGKSFSSGVGNLGASVEQASNRMSGFGSITANAGSEATKTFSSMADRMDKFHVGLNRVTNAMTGLFGTMGLFGMAHESWMFATQRQTNQIYLGMRRGTEEAKNMYNEIMNIVMELPGDDTFLTTILTQASGRDMTMSIENVKQLGDAVADYYVGATAKGQLSFETQRELTSYILTGETRMFTNSILADEIDLLKNKNTVSERSLALQEALNRTGFGGMAHYESAVNEMEEFKGHFQKAFADLGSVALPVVQGILKIYNAFDTLLGNGGISAGLIVLATGIAGLTTALGTIGFVTPMVNEGIKSIHLFADGIGAIRSRVSDTGSVLGFLREHIRGIGTATKESIAPLRTAITEATKFTTSATYGIGGKTVDITQYELENGAILTNTELLQHNLFATVRLNQEKLALKITQSGLTYEQFLENVGLDANTTALLRNLSARMDKTEAELLDLALESDMTTSEFLETLQLNLNTIANVENTTARELNASATVTETSAVTGGLYVRIRETAINVYNTIVKYGSAIASYIKGDATAWETLVSESAILTDLQSIYTKLAESGANLWDAFTVVTVADAKIVENTVTESSIITKMWNIATTITEAEWNSWEAISEFLSADGKIFNALSSLFSGDAKILDTLATIGLNVATWLLNGALVVLNILLSPIGLTILAIVGAVLILIWAFEELGKAFGWWEDIGGMFDAIQSGLQRIWDAFVNSEPVQQIITTFQNLWYTLETLFNFLGSVGGGLWELIFGVDNSSSDGAFDIVGLLLEIGGAIGNFVYWLSPIEEILAVFDALGSYIAWCLDTWNEFIDSAEMQSLIKGFQEVREAFGEVWDEFSSVINEIQLIFGDLWEAIFGGSEETEEASDGTNFFLEILKAIAWTLNSTVVPVLKAFASLLHLILTPLHWVADVLRFVTGLFKDTGDEVETVTDKSSGFIDIFGLIGSVVQGVGDILGGVFGATIESLIRLWEILQPIFNILLQIADYFISTTIDGIVILINNLVTALNGLVSVGRFVVNIFLQMWDAIGGLDGIVGGIQWAFNSLVSTLQPVAEFISKIVDGAKWLEEKFGWVGDQVGQVLNQDGNLANPNNVNAGAEGSIGLLNTLGISPNQLIDTGNLINNELAKNNQEYLNRPINNAQSNDSITKYLRDAPIDAEAYGYLTQPVDYSKTPNMTEPYKTVNSNQQHIVQNIFNEGSVQADARNMSAKDVQTLFTGAFGYNKARGTTGILK